MKSFYEVATATIYWYNVFWKQILPRIRFKHILNIILLGFNLFATIYYDTGEIVSENEAYRSHTMAMIPPSIFFSSRLPIFLHIMFQLTDNSILKIETSNWSHFVQK